MTKLALNSISTMRCSLTVTVPIANETGYAGQFIVASALRHHLEARHTPAEAIGQLLDVGTAQLVAPGAASAMTASGRLDCLLDLLAGDPLAPAAG